MRLTIPLIDSEWAYLEMPVPMSEQNWDLMCGILATIKQAVVEPAPTPQQPAARKETPRE